MSCFGIWSAEYSNGTEVYGGYRTTWYNYVTDEGYLKMWAVKEKMNATGGGSGQKRLSIFLHVSLVVFNMQGAYAPQHTSIGVGT